MVSLKMALDVAGTTRNAFNYWRSADLLKSNFSETSPGVARSLNRENVLEVAYMAALTDIGEAPPDAQTTINMLCLHDESGETYRFLAKRNDAPLWVNSHNITKEILEQLGASRVIFPGLKGRERRVTAAISYSIINVGEIRRRVDELFAEAIKG